MAFNLGFPLVGASVPWVASPTPRRSWQARLFDRFVPATSSSLIGVEDDDKKALVRQGLLQLAAGIQSAPTLGQGLTQGLLAGSQGINQGLDDVQARRLREQQLAQLERNAIPTDFRSKDLAARAAGYEPGTPEYQKFFRVAGGIDARAVSGARKNVEIVGRDGIKRPGVFDPSSPYGYSVYDEASGQFRPLDPGESVQEIGFQPMNGGIPQMQGSNQQMGGRLPDERIIAFANQMAQAGVPTDQVEAWMRNQQAQPQFVGAPQAPAARAPAPASLVIGRSPEEQAFATESAQQRAQLSALPLRGQIEAVSAGQKATAETAARSIVERQQDAIAALPTVLNSTQQTIGLLDQALSHPGRATATGLSAIADPRNYVPGTDASNFQVLLDQIKGQAFLQAFQSLRGAGAITEREGQAATNAIARLNNTKQGDEAFAQSLRDLREIAEKAQRSAIQKAQGQPPEIPQGRSASPARKPIPASLTPEEQAELAQLRARFGRK